MKECSICTHSQLKDINQDLLNGVSVRKIAEKYGIGYRSVYRHKTHFLTSQNITSQHNVTKCDDIKCDDKNLPTNSTVTNSTVTKCDDINSPTTPNRYTHPTVTNSQALGGHWKIIEEAGKVILYFKERIIPIEPYGNHYFDPKSKEEFKKEGNSWFLRIPYFKDGWVNLDNVAGFYE